MMYFWFIPILLVIALVLWMLYLTAAKRAPHRTEGRTVVDKGPDREPDSRPQ